MSDTPKNDCADADDISVTSTVESETQYEYEVETILAEHQFEDGVRYLVKWENYPIERNTWEPKESFCDEQTLLDWEKKKKDIAASKLEGFDVVSWEDKVEALENARAERKRRRREKRIRLGLDSSGQDLPSTGAVSSGSSGHPFSMTVAPKTVSSQTSRPSSFDRPPPRNTSRPSIDRSRPHPTASHPQSKAKSLAKKTSLSLFGSSRPASRSIFGAHSKRCHPADFDSSGPSKRPYKLSTQWRLAKAKGYEPPPDMSQLDIRRPSDWVSMPMSPLELTSRDHKTAPMDNHGVPGQSGHTAAHVEPKNRSKEDFVDVSISARSDHQPRQPSTLQTSSSRSNGVFSGAKTQVSEPTSEDIPSPKMDVTQPLKRSWNPGEVLATIYYGPTKMNVGQAKFCGIGPLTRGGLLQSKNYQKVEVWFKYLCTVDQYQALCYDTTNRKFDNGYLEGFKDTKRNIEIMADDLLRRGLIGICYPQYDFQNVLLVYPAKSGAFSFLNQGFCCPRGNASLFIATRSALQPFKKLELLQNMSPAINQLDYSPDNTQGRGTSAVVKNRLLETRFDTVASPVAQNHWEEKPATSGMSMHHEVQSPAVIGANSGFDLDVLFRDQLSITFKQLAAINAEETVGKTFYVVLPSEENTRAEGDVVIKFLKKHRGIVFSNRIPEDWERFTGLGKSGIVMFHRSFCDYHALPSLTDLLHKPFSFWVWSLSTPIDYFRPPTYFQRIFPHGGVILITEDFMNHDPHGTRMILSWFSDWSRKKFPGSWKIMMRPDVLNWLLKKHDAEGRNAGGHWLAIYYLIMSLNTAGHTSDILAPDEDPDWLQDQLAKHSVISPAEVPGYGSSSGQDDSDILKTPAQEQRDMDLLVEFFAGWTLVNCHRFRRFVVVTYRNPLPRWSSWNHLEIRHRRKQFLNSVKADLESLWKALEGVHMSAVPSDRTGERPQGQSHTIAADAQSDDGRSQDFQSTNGSPADSRRQNNHRSPFAPSEDTPLPHC